ncbi:hypothetical protein HKD37_03G007702 [Glycine soja]
MDEHQQNWKEMTNIMIKINKKTDEMFKTVHDELELTWHLLHSSDNMHTVIYNKDLVSPTLLAGWIELRVTMYSFMKAVRLTNLNLEGTMKCRIVYNHHRNTAKIGNGWRNFTQSQNLLTIIQIIFEFSNLISNFVLFWFCL